MLVRRSGKKSSMNWLHVFREVFLIFFRPGMSRSPSHLLGDMYFC